jgi:hypothetical protein
VASTAADCFCNARSAAECRLVERVLIFELRGMADRAYNSCRSCSRTYRDRALRIITTRAEAATSITTLAAKPAGTQGVSSLCNIHQRTKNNAAEAAAAAVIYPETDGMRKGWRRRANAPEPRVRPAEYRPGSEDSTDNVRLTEFKGKTLYY